MKKDTKKCRMLMIIALHRSNVLLIPLNVSATWAITRLPNFIFRYINLAKFGNEKKPFPKLGNGKGMKKLIPKIREREGNEKNHSHVSGMGGYHSQEYPGTGTGMEKKTK